jgi:hypothetical protein
MMDYEIYCPDCGTKARYFTVWRAVHFFCVVCNQAKVIPLRALGRIGRNIQKAVDEGQLDFEQYEKMKQKEVEEKIES